MSPPSDLETNQTYSFLERVPLGRGLSESEVIEVNGDLSQEVVASEAVIVPDRDPQGAILQLTLRYQVLYKQRTLINYVLHDCITCIVKGKVASTVTKITH